MKVLRKTLKIVTIIIVSFIVFLVILVGVAKIFESDLASYTLSRLEGEIEAPMSIGKVSLIPLFSFPRLSAEIQDLWIGKPGGKNNDTLFCISSLKVGLDTRDFLKGVYTVDKVEITDLSFDYIIYKNGQSNIDFLLYKIIDTVAITDKPAQQSIDTLSTPLDFSAEKIKFKNIQINYFDSLTKTGSKIYIPEMDIKGDAKNNSYSGNSKGKLILSQCRFEETKLHLMEKCAIDFDFEFDNNITRIKELQVISEGINFNIKGNLSINDTITFDTDFNTNEIDITILKKYIPEYYLNEYGITDINGQAEISANLQGQYIDSITLPRVNADIRINNIQLYTKEYPVIKSLNLKANVNTGSKADFKTTVVAISDLKIETSSSSISMNGSIQDLNKLQYNINSSLDLNLAEFSSYIPDTLAKNLSGNVLATLSTSGIVPDSITDDYVNSFLENSHLTLKFDSVVALVNNTLEIDYFSAYVAYSPQDSLKKIQVSDLSLICDTLMLNLQNSSITAIVLGDIAEPMIMKYTIPEFNIQNGSNVMIGNAIISNLDYPEFHVKSSVFLSLAEIKPFIPDYLIRDIEGIVIGKLQSTGMIHPDSIEEQLIPLIFKNSEFEFICKDIQMEFPDSIMNVDNVNADFKFKNDKFEIDKLSATYNGLDFEFDSTIIENSYNSVYLNQHEELYVKTNIHIGDVLYKDFQHLLSIYYASNSPDSSNSLESSTSNPDLSENQNWTFLIHGKASMNSFIMDSTTIEGYNIHRLHIKDFSTLFKLTDSAYIADQFKFKAFEGEMNNSFHYKIRNNGVQSLSSRNVIKDMNIRTLLKDMDNFGADSLITYNNISGLLSTDLNTFIPIQDSIDTEGIKLSGDLTLKGGGVYDYEPAQQLSKFSGIKELDNIKFKTLKSNIFMFKNKIYIPETNIVSNATDISAFGMQSMGDDYEYHLEVHLSNILFGKSKRRNKKQAESGDEIDQESLKKSSHKLIYAEIDGDSKVRWDTKDSRDKMMNKIRTQKKMLDFIFYPKNIHYNTNVDKKD